MAYGFKRFTLLCVSVILIGMVLVYGLKAGLPLERKAEGPITVERIFDEWGLKLSMSVEKTTYAFGEPVNVTLTLTNIGNETVTYENAEIGHRFDFSVHNSTDFYNFSSLVYSWGGWRIFLAQAGEITLYSEESISATLQWPETSKCTPGQHYILGTTGIIGFIKRGEQLTMRPGLLEIEEPIEVTIQPP